MESVNKSLAQSRFNFLLCVKRVAEIVENEELNTTEDVLHSSLQVGSSVYSALVTK